MPDGKPSLAGVAEALHPLPIVAWRVAQRSCDPITFAPPSVDAELSAIIGPGGVIIERAGALRSWSNLDALKQMLLNERMQRRPVKEATSVIPGRKPVPTVFA